MPLYQLLLASIAGACLLAMGLCVLRLARDGPARPAFPALSPLASSDRPREERVARGLVSSFSVACAGLMGVCLGHLVRLAPHHWMVLDGALRLAGVASAVYSFGVHELLRRLAGAPVSLTHVVLQLGFVVLGVVSLVSPLGAFFAEVQITSRALPWGEVLKTCEGPAASALYLLPALSLGLVVRAVDLSVRARGYVTRLAILAFPLSMLASIAWGIGLSKGVWQGPPSGPVVGAFVVVCLGVEVGRSLVATTRERSSLLSQLREWEDLVSAFLRGSQTLAGVLDTDGRILLANQAALHREATTLSEVQGKYLFDTTIWRKAGPSRDRLKVALRRAAAGRADGFQASLQNLRGQDIEVDFSIAPYEDDSGKVVLLVAEGRDVTELRNLERRSRQSQRLEVIGQLSSGVAHEINNLLAGILGVSEVALNEATDEEHLRADLRLIIEATQRGGALTEQLLDFARRGKSRSEPVNLTDAVERSVQLFQRTAAPRFSVRLKKGSTPATVRGDARQLQTMLMNLLVNARDAMPEGGAIDIVLKEQELDHDAVKNFLEPLSAGSYVIVEVRDEGCGIDERDLPRIFEPFFTTKQPGRGTGLGLAAVHGCVREHGGGIRVVSRPQQGTTFFVYLPSYAAEEVQAAPSPPEIDSLGLAEEGLRLLVVDDEPIVRSSMARMLKRLGFTVEVASDGEEGSTRFLEEHFDAVVLDLHMPKMGGVDMALGLRESIPQLPLLIMSGDFASEDLRGLDACTRVRLLKKPTPAADVAEALYALGLMRERRAESSFRSGRRESP